MILMDCNITFCLNLLDEWFWKGRLIEEEFMKRMWNEEGLS